MYYFEIYLGNRLIETTTDARKAERMSAEHYTVICKQIMHSRKG